MTITSRVGERHGDFAVHCSRCVNPGSQLTQISQGQYSLVDTVLDVAVVIVMVVDIVGHFPHITGQCRASTGPVSGGSHHFFLLAVGNG